MPVVPPAFFYLDHPAPGQTEWPAGPLILRGWAIDGRIMPLCDLRIFLNGAEQPVAHGYPRADLAAHFKAREPFPSGFESVITLESGPAEVRFEGCDASGNWHVLNTLSLTGLPSEARMTAPETEDFSPADFARALRLVLRNAVTQGISVAVSSIVQSLPVPRVIRYPARPFYGHLNEPTLHARALFGRMMVHGWLFCETQPIKQVLASVDLLVWQPLTHGGETPFVATKFPAFPGAHHCAIEGWIDVPAQLPRPLTLRIYAQLTDHSWHLCHVYRTYPWSSEEEKAPYAPFRLMYFLNATRTLAQALRARNLLLTRRRVDRLAVIRNIANEVRVQAPHRQVQQSLPPSDIPASTASLPSAVTLISHNLNYEGAPLFLLEYARHLAGRGVRLQVIAPVDGPLAAAYHQLGASVQILDISSLSQVDTARAFRRELRRLASSVSIAINSLVVANTLATYWGVHLAHLASCPSLFYIHESTTPASFYLGHLPAAVLPVIEETFALATHVSFLTAATRAYYLPLLPRANHSINPGWIEIAPLDIYLSANPRYSLRTRFKLTSEDKLVINVGTVCDRKGQHIFIRAVDLLWRYNPGLAATCRFVMVGGHRTPYDQAMLDMLRQCGRTNLEIVPSTAEPLAYYGAADLFVCSSYEESFPRVVLEAMAANVPILSTAVHGIPDMIVNGSEGRLIPPGDPFALCAGLIASLSTDAENTAMVSRARLRVVAEFDASVLLPRHAALAAAVAHSEKI